jgi:hypothetical protein
MYNNKNYIQNVHVQENLIIDKVTDKIVSILLSHPSLSRVNL